MPMVYPSDRPFYLDARMLTQESVSMLAPMTLTLHSLP